MAENKKDKGFPIWTIIIIAFTYFLLGLFAYLFKFNLNSTLLSFFLLTVLYGFAFGLHFLLVKWPSMKKEKKELLQEITPQEAKEMDLEYLLKEYGIVPGKIEIDTPKLVGEEGQPKDVWHWLRFKDRFDDFSVDIFRNLAKIEHRSVFFDIPRNQSVKELISMGSVMAETGIQIEKIIDPITEKVVRIVQTQTPRTRIQAPQPISVEEGTVTGGEETAEESSKEKGE